MNSLWLKIKAALKRNVKAIVRLGLVLVYTGLVAWQARSVSDVLMAFAAWCAIEFVLGRIKAWKTPVV